MVMQAYPISDPLGRLPKPMRSILMPDVKFLPVPSQNDDLMMSNTLLYQVSHPLVPVPSQNADLMMSNKFPDGN